MVLSDDIRARVRSYIQHQATKSREAIVDLVRTSQTKYVDVISSVPDELTTKQPDPDEWSIRQLTLHVITAEGGVARLVAATGRGDDVTTGDRVLGMSQDDDGRPFAQLVDELRRLNAGMLDAIRDLPDPPQTSMTPLHPFFGPLTCLEWAVFQRVHDEDHIQHANKILDAVRG